MIIAKWEITRQSGRVSLLDSARTRELHKVQWCMIDIKHAHKHSVEAKKFQILPFLGLLEDQKHEI